MTDNTIQLKFTEKEIERLNESAKAHGMTLDDFVKSIVLNAMKKTSH